MNRSLRMYAVSAAMIVAGSVLVGCHSRSRSGEPVAEAKPKAPLPLDLKHGKPNEVGVIPILEYHELGQGPNASGYKFPIAGFRKDMERLYKLGYRPIGIHEYLSGHINVPPGMTPFVVTFDDALRGQVDFDAAGNVTPTCAAGVLEAMHTQHKDWALRGVFYVLPMKGTTEYFYQKGSSRQKMQWLVQQGFEVGNHTLHHLAGMHSWPDSRVMAEFAGGQKLIQENIPGYPVDTLALPFGVYPKNLNTCVSGTSGGVSYHNICALMAGAGPAPSPASIKFKPYRIPRMIPGTRLMTIGWWLDYLQKHHAERYISDGDPNTITVPEAAKKQVMMAMLKKNELFFRTYPASAATVAEAAKSKASSTAKP